MNKIIRANLIEALTLLKKVSFDLNSLSPYGYYEHSKFVRINKTKGVVIKNMYFCSGFHFKPAKRVPTLIINKDFEKRTAFCIQPLIETDVTGVSYNLKDFEYFDNHERNLGIFNGKVVMLDW